MAKLRPMWEMHDKPEDKKRKMELSSRKVRFTIEVNEFECTDILAALATAPFTMTDIYDKINKQYIEWATRNKKEKKENNND